MKVALLISTYNWIEALNLVLMSVQKQTKFPDEILIADDGSTEDTKILIDSFRDKIPVPIKHIWQEDKGFRKAKILNKTIAGSDADYIIEVDGDCILHRKFVEDHIKNATPNVFLYGARADTLPDTINHVIDNNIIEFDFFSDLLKKRTRRRGWRIPILAIFYRKRFLTSYRKIRGCNMSFWKKDFIAVNGYNEDLEGWGFEDAEYTTRLTHHKIYGRRLRHVGIMYHLYHNSVIQLSTNRDVYDKILTEKLSWCENGVNKYLIT